MTSPIVVKGYREATAPAAPNPPFANVTALFGFNGVDGATTTTDETGTPRVTTFAGNAQLDTAQKRFGPSSLYLDGTGDYFQVPDSGDWNIGGTDDFQLEMWVRWPSGASFAGAQTFCSQWNTTSNQRAYLLRLNAGTLEFIYTTAGTSATTSTAVSAAWSPATEAQYHLAYARVGGISRLFVEGVKLGQSAVNNFNPFASSAQFRIGGAESSGTVISLLNGWVDEFRMTKFIGGGGSTYLYTTDFVPPSSEFPRS